MTEMLEELAIKTGIVIVNQGECKSCYWKAEFAKRLETNPEYVPYGGLREKCMSPKNYKNCPGYIPNGKKSE